MIKTKQNQNKTNSKQNKIKTKSERDCLFTPKQESRVPSKILESSDSSDNETGETLEMIKRKNKKKKKQVPHYPVFNPKTPMELIEFQPGMIFTSREQLRDVVVGNGT